MLLVAGDKGSETTQKTELRFLPETQLLSAYPPNTLSLTRTNVTVGPLLSQFE